MSNYYSAAVTNPWDPLMVFDRQFVIGLLSQYQ